MKIFLGFWMATRKSKRQNKTTAQNENNTQTTIRIKLSKAKRNNKNIFGVLGFEKINNTSRNKQEKAKHGYTKNWHETNV